MKEQIRIILESQVKENIYSSQHFEKLINNQIRNNKLTQDDIIYLLDGNYSCCDGEMNNRVYEIIQSYLK